MSQAARHTSALRAAVVVLAVALAAAGCAGEDPVSTPTSTEEPGTPSETDEIPVGGTVTMRLGADISSWDPCVIEAATVPGTMGDVLNAVYGALVYTDERGVVQPGMAESLTTEDGVTWMFKLRPDVTFTDGTPYDAEAVKFNFDRAADPANACTSQKWIATWTSIEVVDALTLQVTLPSANANFDLQVAELAAFVGSPASLEGVTDKTTIGPVGAGPFTLVSWDQGVKEVLEKNPDYWDSPRPYIDEYVMLTIPESNTGQNMVVQGGLDFMMGYAYQYGRNASMPGVTTQVVPINGYNIAYFVTDGGPTGLFNDVRARQAVALGVERDRWVEALTQDASIGAPTAMYPEDSPYFDDSLTYPAYSPDEAQRLIDEVIASGTEFEFTILVPNSSDTVRSAQFLQQSMNAYDGVTATINTVEGSVYNQECLAKHGDVCLQPGASMWNSPEPNTYNLLSSTGSQPFSAYASEAMDTALAKTLTAVSAPEKVDAYREVQQVFLEELPFIQYGTQTRTMLMRDNVGGFVFAGQGQVQSQFLYKCPTACS